MLFDAVVSSELLRLREIKQTGIVTRDISFVHPDIAKLAIDLDIPVCALTIIGKHFQHVKVSVGTDLTLMHRDHAFCSHTICQDDVMIVEDATKDVRFRYNPYVVDGPGIRFYAGAPLRTGEGQKLGAVCLIDVKPRTLTAKGRSRLLDATNAIAAKLCLKEQKVPLPQLSIKELLRLISFEKKSITKERTIDLIDNLYDRLDCVHNTKTGQK